MTTRAAEFRALYRDLRISDQRRYYERRRQEYERAHRQAVGLQVALLALASLAGAAGQLTTESGRAALGVVAAVLAAAAGGVTAFASLIGFEQLRKLYDDAALNLAEAEIEWDGAPRGRDLAAPVDRVEQVFRAENGQWGQLVVQTAPVEEATASRRPGLTAPEPPRR
jgi:hypothetical protein